MDIALCFDEQYSPYVSATVESLLDHNRASDLRLWFLVAPDVSGATQAALAHQFGSRTQVRFLEDAELDLDSLPTADHHPAGFTHVSKAAYLRLRLPHLLPASVSRVLYLDVDVLCVGPLDDLFTLDLGDAVIGAVRDPYQQRMCDMFGLPGLEDGVVPDPQAPYFNSGMLLMDVAAWRDFGVTARSLEYVERYREQTALMDQDALNAVLTGRWLRLDKRWNHMRSPRLEPAVGGRLDEARIIHTIGPDKLWTDRFPECERKALWNRYARKAAASAIRDAA
jgi:lipopolysaccharide biosynthesis glycosyltransferase